jgi:16S rRNA (adenine1518-N6/adenine1519-N6)-dimethyltransferase
MSTPHRAKKSLGQNFLTDPSLQQRIVDAAQLSSDDVVIEIGPGQGALTRHIAGNVRRLVLVELDDALFAALSREYEGRPDVMVIHADVLDVDICAIIGADEADSFKVIGNIPYNITTPIIFKLLQQRCRPTSIVLMVQRELADRVVSPAGNKTYGALSVGVQALADVRKLFHVSRGAFKPVPNVDSAVMRIVPHSPAVLSPSQESDLRSLTRTCFGWRRKQLQKILRTAPGYELDADAVADLETVTGISMDARPETLDPSQFVILATALRVRGYPASTDDSVNWE